MLNGCEGTQKLLGVLTEVLESHDPGTREKTGSDIPYVSGKECNFLVRS
jgi:hypothetical protein